jgi:hypothetical protein
MKEVDTEKQLRDEVSALKVQIQELQEEKLEAAATVSLEQPDKDTRIVHFLNNPLQQVFKSIIKFTMGTLTIN